MLTVRLYEPRDSSRWDDYVKRAPDATLYHLIGWKRVIEESFGHRTYYWLAEDPAEEIQGIFPMAHLKSRLFGNFMVSLPFFTYGGVCASDEAVRRALVEAAITRAAKEGADHIEIRHQSPMKFDMPVKQTKVSMRLALPPSSDELLMALKPRLRNKIRGAMKAGMTVRIGRLDELDNFYDVWSINMRDLGTPVYSKDFFRNILTTFPECTWICTVYKEKVPVASGFLIGFRDMIEIPWVSSVRKYNPMRPNILLYWTVLQLACEKGYRIFDFGRSTRGGGTYQFKEQWNTEPLPLYWYYWMRNGGPLPELNPENRKYAFAIALWKRLPVNVTRVIGPAIVKNLP